MNVRSRLVSTARRHDLTPMPGKQKAQRDAAGESWVLTFSCGRTRLFFFRQFLQHRQRLQNGFATHIGTADIPVFAIMGNYASAT
jgi:hypothetical protein